jgi:hypothetical protein
MNTSYLPHYHGVVGSSLMWSLGGGKLKPLFLGFFKCLVGEQARLV